jgi:hypothetical protein
LARSDLASKHRVKKIALQSGSRSLLRIELLPI